MRKIGPKWLGPGLSMVRAGQGRGSCQGEEVRTLWLDLYTQKPAQDLELVLTIRSVWSGTSRVRFSEGLMPSL